MRRLQDRVTQDRKTIVTLEKDGATLVFKGVPARVCSNCGEEYVNDEITARLLKAAADAAERRRFGCGLPHIPQVNYRPICFVSFSQCSTSFSYFSVVNPRSGRQRLNGRSFVALP